MNEKEALIICPHCGNESGGVIGSMRHISKTQIEHYCVVCGKTSIKEVEP